MVIIKLHGGLGNQMFQVAAGLALSNSLNTKLKLDLSFFQNNFISTDNFTARSFAISHFGNKLEIAKAKDIIFFLNQAGKFSFNKIKSKIFRPVVVKDAWAPDILLNITAKNIYLDGYWQSEKYFNRYKKQIIDFFRFPDIPGEFIPTAEKIKNENSVSIHFRRGDYLDKKNISSIHNICDKKYYMEAIEFLSGIKQGIKLFLFSDEPDWLYDNFKPDLGYEIINTRSDITDMHLMSLCKHNIIANSSFSWWGAWLNLNPDKIVIAPQKWFTYDIVNQGCIVPEEWIRI